MDEFLAEDTRNILDVLCTSFINIDEPTLPITYGAIGVEPDGLSIDSLITQWGKHQTYFAAHSVWTQSNRAQEPTTPILLCHQIIKEFYKTLKTSQDKGATTGEARNTRWTKNSAAPEKFAPGDRDGQGDLPVGNASNAATVAASEAKKVCGTSHLGVEAPEFMISY